MKFYWVSYLGIIFCAQIKRFYSETVNVLSSRRWQQDIAGGRWRVPCICARTFDVHAYQLSWGYVSRSMWRGKQRVNKDILKGKFHGEVASKQSLTCFPSHMFEFRKTNIEKYFIPNVIRLPSKFLLSSFPYSNFVIQRWRCLNHTHIWFSFLPSFHLLGSFHPFSLEYKTFFLFKTFLVANKHSYLHTVSG